MMEWLCIALFFLTAAALAVIMILVSKNDELKGINQRMWITQCNHEWIDPSNEKVDAGKWRICFKCGSVREDV